MEDKKNMDTLESPDAIDGNDELNEKESLNIISKMMDKGNQQLYNYGGMIMTWCGMSVVLVLVINYLIARTGNLHWNYLWVLLPFFGVGFLFWLHRTKGRERTSATRTINHLWVLLIIITYLVIVNNGNCGNRLLLPVLAIIYTIGFLATISICMRPAFFYCTLMTLYVCFDSILWNKSYIDNLFYILAFAAFSCAFAYLGYLLKRNIRDGLRTFDTQLSDEDVIDQAIQIHRMRFSQHYHTMILWLGTYVAVSLAIALLQYYTHENRWSLLWLVVPATCALLPWIIRQVRDTESSDVDNMIHAVWNMMGILMATSTFQCYMGNTFYLLRYVVMLLIVIGSISTMVIMRHKRRYFLFDLFLMLLLSGLFNSLVTVHAYKGLLADVITLAVFVIVYSMTFLPRFDRQKFDKEVNECSNR